ELFHILAVIALAIGQAEQAFLQDRILAVPECNREAQALLCVAEAADAVFAPPIGAATRMLMGEVTPGIAVGTVVFAHRAPLALAHIGPPFAPSLPMLVRLFQPFLVG